MGVDTYGARVPAPILVVTGPSGAGKSTVSQAVAATFERAVVLRLDDFSAVIANGYVDPWLPLAEQQNEVVGRAAVSAALEFANGDYFVVLDGVLLPDALPHVERACRGRGIALHYVVLRTDTARSLDRARERNAARGSSTDPETWHHLNDRFARLRGYEGHVIDASKAPEAVTADVLAAYRTGRLVVAETG